jgi:hypothetical protein
MLRREAVVDGGDRGIEFARQPFALLVVHAALPST